MGVWVDRFLLGKDNRGIQSGKGNDCRRNGFSVVGILREKEARRRQTSRGVEVTRRYPPTQNSETINVCKLGSFSPYPCGMNAPGLMNEYAAKKGPFSSAFRGNVRLP